MKAKTVLPILVGGIAVLVAFNQGLFKKKSPPKPKYLVAMEEMPANRAIRGQSLGIKEWTDGGALPEGFISHDQMQRFRGRFVRTTIEKGRPITEDALWPMGVTSIMMAKLISDPTARGVTIKVDSVTGGAGFVNPGDSVDVMATGNLIKNSGLRAKVILQGVEVLAINRRASRGGTITPEGTKKAKKGAERLDHVTLLLTSSQAERLKAMESQRGVKLQFILAGPNAKRVETTGASVRDALGMGPPPSASVPVKATPVVKAEPPPPKEATPRYAVEVRQGDDSEKVRFKYKDGVWVPIDEEADEDSDDFSEAPPE